MPELDIDLHIERPGLHIALQARLPGRGITALFGPSGCGKTSVLRALAGLERARGRLVVQGEVWQDDTRGLWRAPHQRALGYVIQEAALFPHLNVERNLRYGESRIAPAQRRIVFDDAVQWLGIAPLLRRAPASLSGGERQRVAIARALLTSPRLLLMDEPLAALDAARKAEILPYLERLHAALAMPIVYVTHAMDEVTRLADHLVLMDAGRVTAHGPLHTLLARSDLPLHLAEDACSVIDAVVAEHDAPYALSRLHLPGGGALWIGGVAQPVGAPVRARVLARDVSVARARPTLTSILNVLPVTLVEIHHDGSTTSLGLALGHGAPPGEAPAPRLLARITRRSADALALRQGDQLFAQVKGAALMR